VLFRSIQITEEINELGKFTPIRAMTVYGGERVAAQAKKLERGNTSFNLAIETPPQTPKLQINRAALDQIMGLVREIQSDVDAAARLTALLPPGELQLHAVANVARPYAAKDPAAALAWSDSFTGLARRAAFSNTALAWSERDPAAAAQWLATQPPIATSPDTLPNVFAAWLGTDAPAARAWLATAPLTPETKASLESRAR
jgi:hypothetical protein